MYLIIIYPAEASWRRDLSVSSDDFEQGIQREPRRVLIFIEEKPHLSLRISVNKSIFSYPWVFFHVIVLISFFTVLFLDSERGIIKKCSKIGVNYVSLLSVLFTDPWIISIVLAFCLPSYFSILIKEP